MTSIHLYGGKQIVAMVCCRQPVTSINSVTRNSNRTRLGLIIEKSKSSSTSSLPPQPKQQQLLQQRWFQSNVSKKLSAVEPSTASTFKNNAADGATTTTTATTKVIKTIKRVKKIKKKSLVITSHEKYSAYTATPIGNKALQQYEWINFAPYGIKIVDYSKCNTTSTTPMSRWPLPQAPSKKPGTYDKRYLFAFLTIFMTGSVYYVYNYSEPLPPGYWEAIERGDMPIEDLIKSADGSNDSDSTIHGNNFVDDEDLDENFDEWADEKK
jgi:hypothetical protein